MSFYRCGGGGNNDISVSAIFTVSLPSMSTFTIDTAALLGQSTRIKGVVIYAPSMNSRSYGGCSVHAIDIDDAMLETIANIASTVCQSVSTTKAAVSNPSGGYDSNSGGYYNESYAVHPTWSLTNDGTTYSANRLTGAVNTSTTLSCKVCFIF